MDGVKAWQRGYVAFTQMVVPGDVCRRRRDVARCQQNDTIQKAERLENSGGQRATVERRMGQENE